MQRSSAAIVAERHERYSLAGDAASMKQATASKARSSCSRVHGSCSRWALARSARTMHAEAARRKQWSNKGPFEWSHPLVGDGAPNASRVGPALALSRWADMDSPVSSSEDIVLAVSELGASAEQARD